MSRRLFIQRLAIQDAEQLTTQSLTASVDLPQESSVQELELMLEASTASSEIAAVDASESKALEDAKKKFMPPKKKKTTTKSF